MTLFGVFKVVVVAGSACLALQTVLMCGELLVVAMQAGVVVGAGHGAFGVVKVQWQLPVGCSQVLALVIL